MNKIDVREVVFIFILFIFLIGLIMVTPFINRFRNDGELIINEVMSSNSYTIMDKTGKYSDYIELYNGYNYEIDLSGYYLSDDYLNTRKWQIPSGVKIGANSYLLLYATGLDKVIDGECHTNFKLDKGGEVVSLSNKKGKAISKIIYNAMDSDTSYGYNEKEKRYVYYYEGTPLKENGDNYSLRPITIKKKSGQKIVEYVTDNRSIRSSKEGYYQMVEIYNETDKDVDMTGYMLTNDRKAISKYVFGSVVIKAKGYLVVYLSGLDKMIDGECHTNFKLLPDDKVLILSDDKKNTLDEVRIVPLGTDMSYGLYDGKWYYYDKPSIGRANDAGYKIELDKNKDIVINEISAVNMEFIELKNLTDKSINLSNYSIKDKSGKEMKFPNIEIKGNGYLTLYGSDNYSYNNGKIYTGFHINNSQEVIYLYKNNVLIDTFNGGLLNGNVSMGRNASGRVVYFKNKTMGSSNSSSYYLGYANSPKYSATGGYVSKGYKLELSTDDGSEIYYTVDGSFPTRSSIKYKDGIIIDKTMVVKAIAYRDNYLESSVVSRTFFVGEKKKLPIVSISTNRENLFGSYGIISNYHSNNKKKISFEFYEADGKYGISFIGDMRLSGMDSRERVQKSMAIYLKKEYGMQSVNYPFFKYNKVQNYSSFTLRNAGEDPLGIRIQDTTLTYMLQGEMDIDLQDYRAVVVYVNGEYYGLYNMRERLNGDYLESYGYDKDNSTLIKYTTAKYGSTWEYNKLYNYIKSHNVRDKDVYEYLKSQIDMQELVNYMIVESFYGNTDLGNIRFYKGNNGKWRWMLYDLDWSMWNYQIDYGYPIINKRIPAVTYLYSVIDITRTLYHNSEFRELYLSSFGKYLKTTFKPERVNKIIDMQSKEIEDEISSHIERWRDNPRSVQGWKNNINLFKTRYSNRYNYVVNNIKSSFNLSQDEYDKYFK